MSARENLIAHTASLLWQAWTASSEDMASEAAATLHGLGMLVPEGGAAELERLRLLTNAQPAQLTEAQVEALADAGNRALNDHYHDDLCHCRDWPNSCGHYFAGTWDTAAFDIGMAAVIGLWESMRAPAEAAELAALRARVAELEAAVEKVAGFCAQRAEYVTNLRHANPNADHDYYRWTGHAEARRQLSRLLGLPVGWPAEDAEEHPASHEGPEEHTYRLSRDLAESGSTPCPECQQPTPEGRVWCSTRCRNAADRHDADDYRTEGTTHAEL